MAPLLRRLALAAALVAGMAAHPADAGDVADAEAATFRAMVMAQIEAFRRDDATAAYRLASPTIQGLYPGEERFMAMVRLGYAPLHRARSVAFGQALETPDGPELHAYVTGPDGRAWRAVYSFQKQADGTWRINGCVLSEDHGKGA